MEDRYITITGIWHYYGKEPFEKKGILHCVKEKNNEFDKEAIKVTLNPLGTVGYVGNSAHTVVGDCFSAGRIYDKVGDEFDVEVTFIFENNLVAKVVDYGNKKDGLLKDHPSKD